jgi:hypothetical protein
MELLGLAEDHTPIRKLRQRRLIEQTGTARPTAVVNHRERGMVWPYGYAVRLLAEEQRRND